VRPWKVFASPLDRTVQGGRILSSVFYGCASRYELCSDVSETRTALNIKPTVLKKFAQQKRRQAHGGIIFVSHERPIASLLNHFGHRVGRHSDGQPKYDYANAAVLEFRNPEALRNDDPLSIEIVKPDEFDLNEGLDDAGFSFKVW